MNTKAKTNQLFRLLFAALCMVAFTCTAMLALPADAQALETVKCTAKPNGDSGSSIMGGVETRITWETRADASEQISSLRLTLPAGTEFSTENARLTMLSGADLMTRTNIEANVYEEPAVGDAAGAPCFVAEFNQPAQAGGYFRIEIYGVVFPMAGGSLPFSGAAVLADGSEVTFDVPSIEVVPTSPLENFVSNLEQQEWVQAWNSNKFLRLFLNPPLLVSSFPVVFNGFLLAVGIVAVAFPLAIPLGLVLALMRMSKFRVLRGLATTYVNVVRGTPLFLQIYIAFFGLPLAGVQIPSFVLGVIVLAMNSSAYLCEIFRAGIQSISKGQFEASRSLGMNGAQTMLFVIIPQTVRRVIPTMTSEFILLYKDTSMLAAVGVMEVVMYAKTIVASTGSITPYIVAACFYLVITLPLAKLVGMLEAKLAGNDAGKSKKRKKKVRAGAQPAGASVPTNPKMADAVDGDCITPEKMSSL